MNVKETIEKVMEIQMYKAQTIGIKLEAQFIGFEENPEYLVSTDEQRLQQVLLNFQSNALKFTQAGGEVKIICELIDDIGDFGMLKVSVQDNGVGIK